MLIDSLVSVLKAIGKDIKTIADSVDKKADSADLSSKRDISNTEFTKSIAVKADDYSGIKLYNTAGGYARLECAPEHNTGIIASIIKRDKNDALKYVLSLPARNGTLATTDQIPEGGLGNAPFRQNNTSNAHLIKNNYWGLWTSAGTLNFDWFTGNKTPYVAFDTQGIKIQGILVRHVVSESTSGPGFWREWNDGWLEQGGYVASSGRDTQLNYNRPFRSEPSINVIARARDSTYLSGSQSNMQVSYMGNTGCRISMYDANNLQGYYWQAWGWKA